MTLQFHKQRSSSYYYLSWQQDLGEYSNMVSYRHIPNIHQEPINRMMFEPDTNVVMTSSESDTTSVVFINVTLKREPYIWRFKQVTDVTV